MKSSLKGLDTLIYGMYFPLLRPYTQSTYGILAAITHI